MVKSRLVVVCIIFALCAAFGGQRPAPAASAQAEPPGTDQFIVWLEAAPPADPAAGLAAEPAALPRAGQALLAASLSAGAGADLHYARPAGLAGHIFKLDAPLPPADALALAARLQAQPGVARAEPDWRVYPAAAPPNDPFWYNLWALRPYESAGGMVGNAGIDALAAWNYTTGDPNLVIAVIDSGVVPQHEDLLGRLVGGYDLIADTAVANDGDGRDPDPTDDGFDCGYAARSNWHGSHVAGTIAAAGNNGLGVAGVNWQSKIMPVRVLGCGGGYTTDIVDAIRWSVGAPTVFGYAPPNPDAGRVKVINLSLGGSYACPYYLQEAVDLARWRGVMVVAAAGNDGGNAAFYAPASCAGVIAVGASNRAGMRAYYSNYGSVVQVSAPGGEYGATYLNLFEGMIFSAVWNPYSNTSSYDWSLGTSMAAPHVSGVLSLMLSLAPDIPPELAERILQGTASPFAPQETCRLCGSGIVHAGRAAAAANNLKVIKAPSTYAPAFAGDAARPMPFTVVTARASNPNRTNVRVGGMLAAVQRVETAGDYDLITVLPVPMPANGVYDLRVTVNGVYNNMPGAVQFGSRLLLPKINR